MINFSKFNRHWTENVTYPYEKKRDFFETLLSFKNKRQIIALTGLRRTGKTVLMKQLINQLVTEGTPRRNILYFSFDEAKPPLDELLTEYKGATAVDLEKDNVYIFLDEVQKLDNWQNQVKTYYDNYENLKFFVTGSSTLFIKKKAEESLAGRVYVLELPVLTFKEYLDFRGKTQQANTPDMFAEEMKSEFLTYVRRNFIETINEDDATTRLYLESIVNKIVYEDIPALFPVENPEKLKTILKAVYSNPGMLINYANLGNDLGLNARTVEKYVDYLVKTRIIKKLYNYSRNFLTSEKKSKKLYVTAPSFCFLNEEHDFSKIAENVIASNGPITFFWRTPQKEEIDFIANINGKPYPIESKYSEKPVSTNDLKALKKFLRQNSVPEGRVITKTTETPLTNGIRQTPLWKYALNPDLPNSEPGQTQPEETA